MTVLLFLKSWSGWEKFTSSCETGAANLSIESSRLREVVVVRSGAVWFRRGIGERLLVRETRSVPGF